MDIIELERWKPSEANPHKLEYAGQPVAQEVFEELKHRLEGMGYLPDEYFLLDGHWKDGREIPKDADIFCTTDYGASEGVYLDVYLKWYEDGKPITRSFITGKTLGENGNDLDRMYAGGLGTEQNDREALVWFEKVARQRNPYAEYQMAKHILADPSAKPEQTRQAVGWLTHAAEAGLDCAQHALGKLYRDGGPVAQDMTQAVIRLSQAAERGNQYAMYALGKLRLEADDPAAARRWFRQSADLGNQFAQYQLGKCWPGIRTISAELRLSRSTVKRALDDLCKAELISKEHRWRENGSLSSNLYRLK